MYNMDAMKRYIYLKRYISYYIHGHNPVSRVYADCIVDRLKKQSTLSRQYTGGKLNPQVLLIDTFLVKISTSDKLRGCYIDIRPQSDYTIILAESDDLEQLKTEMFINNL